MKKNLLFVVFLGLATLTFAQPSNDLCSGATPLTVNATCANTLVTFDGTQTDSGVPDPGCATYIGGDLWYSIVMPASGNVRIESSQNGSITDGGMAAYSGICSSLSLLVCDDNGAGGGVDEVGGFERIDVSQPSGSTVYIRLWTNNDATVVGDYDICVFDYTPPPPPVNDDCSGAIDLSIDVVCTPIIGANSGATASEDTDTTIPNPECANYVGGDVWFKVTVPASGHFQVETYEDDLSITDGGMAIYSGNCGASGLTLLACDDDGGNITSELFELIELSVRTPGEILYIRVWSYGNDEVGTFNICAIELAPLSINTEELETFTMFPNPVKNTININFNHPIDGNNSIEIFNVLGELILEKNTTNQQSLQLDVSDFKSGMYILKYKNGAIIKTEKLLIE
ncbi:MAG: T9SS type A sorting domain-containing protein [Flavobacteriaceae bacterium]|nr:T9SS type A sorting domain-containing protein [Flavobacteriaceae bacterium]